jgi:hypothetical protein
MEGRTLEERNKEGRKEGRLLRKEKKGLYLDRGADST